MPTRTERKEASRVARRLEDRREVSDASPRPVKRRGGTAHSRPWGLEYRVRPGRGHGLWADEGWRRSWHWYKTEARRDAAMAAMNRREDLFEYRPIQRG